MPELRIDLDVPLGDATMELEALLRHFEPFGLGNPAPVFVARGVRIVGPPRTVGQGHLKLRLEQDGALLDAIGFGLGGLAEGLRQNARVDVAFRLELDEWEGAPRLQARLADVRA